MARLVNIQDGGGQLVNLTGGMSGNIKIPNAYNFQVTDPSQPNYWIEGIGDDGVAPNADEYGQKFAHSSLTGWVSDDEMYDMVNSALGYAIDTGDNTKIHRVNPISHPNPKNAGQYAFRVSDAQGLQYAATTTSIIQNPADNALGINKFANFGRRQVTIEFAPTKVTIREDPEINLGEYQRNIDYSTKPNIYDVTIQTGAFFYAEGAADNPKNRTLPGEVNFLEVKTTFNVVWRLVPENFVCDTTGIFAYPTQLVSCAGKVNSTAFGGFPAGTLLMLEPEIDRYVSGTLRSDDGRTPIYMYDVVMPIIHFDPPNFDGSFRGHNLKPWWKNGDATITYYLITNKKGDPAGIRVYGSTDYNKLFSRWSA